VANLTVIHQYGSRPPFQRNETKFGRHPGGTMLIHIEETFTAIFRSVKKPSDFIKQARMIALTGSQFPLALD
jgi:hypothetical protein